MWKGGLGIWGAIAGGVTAGGIVARRAGADVALGMDCVAPGLVLAQAIGRLGNWVNQELFGGPTSLPWGLEISPDRRPAGYEQYATFQPTFLYELLWNLARVRDAARRRPAASGCGRPRSSASTSRSTPSGGSGSS